HQAESAKREGDGRGLEGADLLLEERDRQHRDERRSRGDDERRGPRGHRRVGFTEVQKEVVSGEADKREEGQPGKVRPTRGGPELAPRRKGTDEQQVGNHEAQERQGDPRHVPEGLLDRDEREPPDQDEEEHGAVDGPARAEPVRQRHAAGTWAGGFEYQKAGDLLPAGRWRKESFPPPPRDAPADEEGLPLVYVPFVEAALDEFRDAFGVGGIDVLPEGLHIRERLLEVPDVLG